MPEHLAPHGAEVERDSTGHPLVRPQLIATDLDGTIIPYSQTHTATFRRALLRHLRQPLNPVFTWRL